MSRYDAMKPIANDGYSFDSSYTEVVELVFPNHANSLGISFGGQIMQVHQWEVLMHQAPFTYTYKHFQPGLRSGWNIGGIL